LIPPLPPGPPKSQKEKWATGRQALSPTKIWDQKLLDPSSSCTTRISLLIACIVHCGEAGFPAAERANSVDTAHYFVVFGSHQDHIGELTFAAWLQKNFMEESTLLMG